MSKLFRYKFFLNFLCFKKLFVKMSELNSIFRPHTSDTVQKDSQFNAHANLMSAYACALKEKVQLEKQITILKFTNSDLESRLKEAEEDMKQLKNKLHLNEEIVTTLKRQIEENKQSLVNEQEVYKNFSEQREAMIADLRSDIKILRKRLCGTTADLKKSEKRTEMYRERCLDYKDKLRGFAILFTYFNDPQREKSETSDELISASNCTSSTGNRDDQDVQSNYNDEILDVFRR